MGCSKIFIRRAVLPAGTANRDTKITAQVREVVSTKMARYTGVQVQSAPVPVLVLYPSVYHLMAHSWKLH